MVVRRDLQTIVCIHRFSICVSATLRDPGSVAGAKHRVNCRHETAGRNGNRDGAVLPVVDVRFAIGDNEESVALQLRTDVIREPIWGPY